MRSNRSFLTIGGILVVAFLFFGNPSLHAQSTTFPVLTQRYDNSRSGANLNETILNTTNVNVNQFGKLFSYPVTGHVYAQPLYVPGVSIPGKGKHNVIYIATMHNQVYAFDADDPNQANTPFWVINLGPSAPLPDVFAPNFVSIQVEVGILSTPVIDVASQTMYVTAFTKDGPGNYKHRLHALDITTGSEKLGGPVTIRGSINGFGPGSVNGVQTFNPMRQGQRPALLLSRGILYIAFASYGDILPYQGWVFAYNARTLGVVNYFNTAPNGSAAGVWMGGTGPSVDERGNVYLIAGNGTFDVYSGGGDLGDSFIKFDLFLNPLDWFTPFNQAALSQADLDIGSTGPLLISGTNLLLGGGKQGVLYVLDRNHLGYYNPSNDNQIIQSFKASTMLFGTPVYWKGPNNAMIYLWGQNDALKAFQLVNGKFQTAPVLQNTSRPGGFPGTFLAISANHDQAGSGILWANLSQGASAGAFVVPGVLRAFNAETLDEIWNSQQNAARDSLGGFAKFNTPTIVNGKVYMGTFSNQVVVYGLLN